jgi:DNA-binding transcriptional LysR family regulator
MTFETSRRGDACAVSLSPEGCTPLRYARRAVTRQWSGLELRHLLALKAVAERGSFHRAAELLDYTQSGISQQISGLERIVGEQLVERPGGSRPVRLTRCGELLLRHADAVLQQIGAAQADVRALRNGATGPVRLGAFQSVGATVLPALLERLSGSGMRVELTQTTSDPELFELLHAGDLDMTFAMLPPPPGPFAVIELFAEPFVAMIARESPLAGLSCVALRELALYPFVLARTCRSTAHAEAQMREHGIDIRVAHRSDDNGTVLGLVAGGAGVALVPQTAAVAANGAVAALEIEEPLPPRRVALAWRHDRQLPTRREAFVREVVATCRELGLDSKS